jgi:hypothetical protein
MTIRQFPVKSSAPRIMSIASQNGKSKPLANRAAETVCKLWEAMLEATAPKL